MELQDALSQISNIHDHMAKSQVFRGYRSITTAISGAIAMAAAVVQERTLEIPGAHPKTYLFLWVAVALLSLAIVGTEMVLRCRRLGSQVQTRLTLMAVESFLPSIIGGASLTYVLFHFTPEILWLLPALWMMLFAMGIFASSRILPRATFWAGAYYLVAAVLCLALYHGPALLNPWIMGLVFGLGQLFTAGILYFTLELNHDQPQS